MTIMGGHNQMAMQGLENRSEYVVLMILGSLKVNQSEAKCSFHRGKR